jgi:hypothetical protein
MMSISSPSSLDEVLMTKVDGICDEERACRAERADSSSLHLAMINLQFTGKDRGTARLS